ncbi:MAG TPA: hypothetical protein VF157_10175 [Chloroflexota bacterium]
MQHADQMPTTGWASDAAERRQWNPVLIWGGAALILLELILLPTLIFPAYRWAEAWYGIPDWVSSNEPSLPVCAAQRFVNGTHRLPNTHDELFTWSAAHGEYDTQTGLFACGRYAAPTQQDLEGFANSFDPKFPVCAVRSYAESVGRMPRGQVELINWSAEHGIYDPASHTYSC